MSEQKVKFLYGNNDKYDYYIVAEREKVKLEKNELAYKIDKQEYVYIIKNFGNFDFQLEKRSKESNEYCGIELVNKNEIELE